MSDFFKQLMQGMRQHYRNQHRDNFDFEIRPHKSPYAVKAEQRLALEEELAEQLNRQDTHPVLLLDIAGRRWQSRRRALC